MGLLSKKVNLFRVSGIQVQLHVMFILFAGYELWIFREFLAWGIEMLLVLWLSVLLHELGHCWGARRVGGDATEILLWPLGGLATVDAPRTPWAQFVTTASGPAVNLILALAGLGVAALVYHAAPLDVLLDRTWAGHASTVVSVNALLFLFNTIPAFPLDMGRIVQVALWPRLGFKRSLTIAVYLSFVCCAGLVIWGIVRDDLLLSILGVWVLQSALGELQQLRSGVHDDADEPWRQTFTIREERPSGPGPVARFLARRAEARERARAESEARQALRLDEVLRRVGEVGMDGLSREERSFLDGESARLRGNKRPGEKR